MRKKISMKSRTLRPQLLVAYSLMSIIPILALSNLIFPSFLAKEGMGVVVLVAVILSLFGFFVIKKIVDSIIHLNTEIKSITNGEVSRCIQTSREDELGELSQALNQLTHHIKDNMDELKIYGERTKDINSKINKQVVALNGVLQMGDFISAKTSLKDIFDMTVSRIAQITDESCSFIILKKEGHFEMAAQFGLSGDAIISVKAPANEYIFSGLLSRRKTLTADARDHAAPQGDLLKVLKVKRALIHPIYSHGEPRGFLGIANVNDGDPYGQDDVELLDVFSKQLGIAVENDYLSKRVQDLEIMDGVTELYNRRYITMRLEEEILRSISHQKPCAFIMLKLKGLNNLLEKSGAWAVEDLLRRTAAILKTDLKEFDRAGRIGEDEFGLILSETNKKQAQEQAERFKARLIAALATPEALLKQDICVVAVENPVDGSDAATLMEKAEKTLSPDT